MLDKRTPRSQNFKNYQLQQQQQSFSPCDALPQLCFDFALADPLSANIYELLKATYLFLDATQSPICSTLRSAIIQFEQFAAISSVTIASVVTSSIEYQLVAKGFLRPTKLSFDTSAADVASPDIPDATTPQLHSVSGVSTIHDEFLSLLDFSASQLESQCALLEQQIQLCEQFHSIKENFSICEAHNLRLDDDLNRLTTAHSILASEFSCLQADHAQLCQKAKPTLRQERALLVYSAAIAQFRKSCQTLIPQARDSRSAFGFHIYLSAEDMRTSAYHTACDDWRSRFGNIPPPSQLPDDYG